MELKAVAEDDFVCDVEQIERFSCLHEEMSSVVHNHQYVAIVPHRCGFAAGPDPGLLAWR